MKRSTQSNNIFTRIEKKYVLNREQYIAIMPVLYEHMCTDIYGERTIGSIYYDTPNDRIIRSSISKPVYKEKLRLRCYQTPDDDSEAFIELKKKYKGIVYKRRICMKYADALAFLSKTENTFPEASTQIGKEIIYFLNYYDDIQPSYALFCHRMALVGIEQPDLRLTIDSNLRYRKDELDLRMGTHGIPLLPNDKYIMEVKVPMSMPLWMVKLLDENKIYPSSFSKFGTAYILESTNTGSIIR